MISRPKRNSTQVAVGLLSALIAAALIVLLGRLAMQFSVRLADTFEVVASIVGWILLPLRI